jgi:outer membrane protein assembly factor BamB
VKRPTLEESREAVRQRAVEAASAVLTRRGQRFAAARTVAEAAQCVIASDRLVEDRDFLLAAATLLQADGFKEQIEQILPRAQAFADWLGRQGDDLFYDRGDPESVRLLQLAAGLDPGNSRRLRDVIAPCLQLSPMQPREALPYAVLVAALDPQRDEVAYIERCIHQESVFEQRRRPGEWLTAGGDNARHGAAPVGLRPPLRVLWESPLVSPSGGIVISNGVAVCGQWRRGDWSASIHAVDMTDGSVRWSYPMRGIVAGWPVISGDFVYLGRSAEAVCLDLASGVEVWRTVQEEPPGDRIPVATSGNPLCEGSHIIFRDDDVCGFDALTGRRTFSAGGSHDPRMNAGACSDGKDLYLPAHRELLRVPLDSMTVAATVLVDGKITAGPTLADGMVICCTNRGIVQALDRTSLETVWSFRIEEPTLHAVGMDSACAFANGRLFFGGLDGNLYALDASTGARIWKHQTGESVDTTPLVCGDFVYLNAANGLCAFRASDGELLWSERPPDRRGSTGNTGLAVSGAVLLAGSDRLRAFTAGETSGAEPE